MASEENDKYIILRYPEELERRLPANVIRAINELPFVIGGEGPQELDRIREGKCVACNRDLAADTLVVMNQEGIQSLACGGACHDDLMIMGYLQEQMADTLERVAMRQNLTEGHD